MRVLSTIPNARLEAFRFERPDPFPRYSCPRTRLRFDVPSTLRVDEPNMVAVFAKRVVTLRVFMLDVPSARIFKVFRYGIVKVSKRNDVFDALDTKAPFTDKLSATFRLVTFAVPRT